MGLKFNCPNPDCQARIAVEWDMAGKTIVCPSCSNPMEVPKSSDIRFNCPHEDCAQHIVADVSESGRFIKCPGCARLLRIPGAPPKSIAHDIVRQMPARATNEKNSLTEEKSAGSWRRHWLAAGLIRLVLG